MGHNRIFSGKLKWQWVSSLLDYLRCDCRLDEGAVQAPWPPLPSLFSHVEYTAWYFAKPKTYSKPKSVQALNPNVQLNHLVFAGEVLASCHSVHSFVT